MSVFSSLAQRLPLLFDEPAAYYAARLAAHHRRPVRMFTADFGMNLQRLADGCKTAISKLADMCRIDADALMRSSLHKQDGDITLKSQRLRKTDLRRSRVFVCPGCLADDVASSDLPPSVAIHGRANWMLQTIRTCPHHQMALVEIAGADLTRDAHDWTLNAAPVVPRISRLCDAATLRPPSSLETYLLNRLDGEPAGIWLDTLDFYAAVHVAELFGACAAFGKRVNFRTLGEDDLYRAGDAGFPIVAHGAPGIHEFMRTLKSEHVSKNKASADGPQAVYGKIYMSLSQGLAKAAFDPVRDIMAANILDNFALGPGDDVFGKPVLRRRFHSIRTASQAYDMHQKRLRKLVVAEGLVADPSQPDCNILFDAEIADRIFKRERNSVSLKEAERYLNVRRPIPKLLVDAGLIQRHRVGIGRMNEVFFAAELNAFLTRLLGDARPLAAAKPPMMDIANAARRACCPITEIVKLILDRKLQNVGKLESRTGFASLLVDIEEVRSAVKLKAPDGLPPNTVARTILKTNVAVMAQLVKCGAIRTVTTINPVNRCTMAIIQFAEIERFQKQFVSLHHVARSLGLHMTVAKKRLADGGIKPAPGFEGVNATFYKRAELAAIGFE
ncbi:MAG: TniQ family protein [Rhizobiales bacterium]|nr:TniQ family protein [Hyphomicrobiales bacterium]